MVENSTSSTKVARRNTGKTKSLSPEQAIEILQQAVLNCQQSGIDVKISPLYGNAGKSVVIVLANTEIIDGNLRLEDGRMA